MQKRMPFEKHPLFSVACIYNNRKAYRKNNPKKEDVNLDLRFLYQDYSPPFKVKLSI